MPPRNKPSTNGRAHTEPKSRLGYRRSLIPGGSKSCLVLAKETNLIEIIQSDIESTGLVGEKYSALMVYLAASSRKLKKPMAITLRGTTSSGKTQILNKALSLFPPEEIVDATTITPNALYRMEAGSLENKILKTGERRHRNDENTADTNAALRQLLSEGRISKLCPMKGEGGWTTQLITQEGPVAYFETTTADSIFEEDLNRMVQLRTDASEEQTRAVMKQVAHEYSPDVEQIDQSAIIDRHKEFQNKLEFVNVRIPYAEVIAEKIPAGKIEARRVIQQVFTTIEAIAFLHQFQREQDSQGRILATKDDYRLARSLLIQPLNDAIGGGNRAQHAYKKLRKAFPKREFTSTQTIDTGCFNNKVTRDKALKELVNLDVLKCIKGKGRIPSRYKWTGGDLEMVLPSVKSVS